MCKLLLSCNDVHVQLIYEIWYWLHLENADYLSDIPLHVIMLEEMSLAWWYFRILGFGGSTVSLFAQVEIMMSCLEIHNALLSINCGAVISSNGSTVCRVQWTVKHWRTRYRKASTVDIEKLNPDFLFMRELPELHMVSLWRPVRRSLFTMVHASLHVAAHLQRVGKAGAACSHAQTGIISIGIHPILTHVKPVSWTWSFGVSAGLVYSGTSLQVLVNQLNNLETACNV
jgi:hypothetical protein